jgi:hypothetical protein
MDAIEKILKQMRSEPANVRFADLQRVCEPFLVNPGKTAAATPSTRHRGQEIQG